MRERLIDILMTKVLRHDIKNYWFTLASLHSHVCGIDRKNNRPTLAEVAGIAVTSTKHVKGANVRRYVTIQDETGFWICLDYSSERKRQRQVLAGRKRKRRRKAAHEEAQGDDDDSEPAQVRAR